ncbi:MAG: ACT domain-containing protein [Clostridia bacterium]|nr:ACT domain-containing protein [Clostridia bacterium]
MAIQQLTVFVENTPGAIIPVTETLANNNINLRALSLAETEDFGILRLIVTDTARAEQVLKAEGYLTRIAEVVGVKIGDAPGKLSDALKVLAESKVSLEYLYSFFARTERHAYVVLRVEDNAAAQAALTNAGLHLITDADIQKL